jgi:hypothetical protein
MPGPHGPDAVRPDGQTAAVAGCGCGSPWLAATAVVLTDRQQRPRCAGFSVCRVCGAGHVNFQIFRRHAQQPRSQPASKPHCKARICPGILTRDRKSATVKDVHYRWRKKEAQTDPVLMEGEAISQVYEFKYLGYLFTADNDQIPNVEQRIGRADAVFRVLSSSSAQPAVRKILFAAPGARDHGGRRAPAAVAQHSPTVRFSADCDTCTGGAEDTAGRGDDVTGDAVVRGLMVPGGDGNGATGTTAPPAAEPAPGTGRRDADISALSYFTVDSVGTPSGAAATGGGSRAANVDRHLNAAYTLALLFLCLPTVTRRGN